VTTAGQVTIYRWDHELGSHDHAAWVSDVLPDPVISGGVHVHGFRYIVMTDNYPTGPNQWRVGLRSFDVKTEITIYALTMTGAKVSIHDWKTSINERTFADWTTGHVGGTVIGGGIWVHGWNDVRMFNSYPASTDTWGIGSANMESHRVDVNLYALLLT
jgi:hypothetical protein